MLNNLLEALLHWMRRAILHKYFPEVWYATENWLTAVSSGKKILEIGCGRGLMTDALVKSKWEVSAIDPSTDSIARAKDRLQDKSKFVNFINCEPECLPFENNSFDAVICANMLEFVVNPNKVLLEIQRVLKPGGKATIIVFNSNSLWAFNIVAGLLRKDTTPRPFKCFTHSKFESIIRHSGLELDSIKNAAAYLPFMPKSISIPWPVHGAFIARLAKVQKENLNTLEKVKINDLDDKRGILSSKGRKL